MWQYFKLAILSRNVAAGDVMENKLRQEKELQQNWTSGKKKEALTALGS